MDLTPLEVEASDSARPVAGIIPETLRRYGLGKKRVHAEIIKVWGQLLDPNLTAHAQPAGFVKGTLFVKVDSSVWLDEIVRYRRREILDRLRHTFGKETIERISFRLG